MSRCPQQGRRAVTGRVTLRQIPRRQPAGRRRRARPTSSSPPVTSRAGARPYDRAAARCSQRCSSPGSRPRRPGGPAAGQVLDGFKTAGFLTLQRPARAACHLAVVIAPAAAYASTTNADAENKALVATGHSPWTTYGRRHGRRSATADAAADGGMIKALRDESEAAKRVSTVDTADASTGRVVVFALGVQHELAASPVHYGIGLGRGRTDLADARSPDGAEERVPRRRMRRPWPAPRSARWPRGPRTPPSTRRPPAGRREDLDPDQPPRRAHHAAGRPGVRRGRGDGRRVAPGRRRRHAGRRALRRGRQRRARRATTTWPVRRPRGLQGTPGALAHGEVTSGAVKILGIGATGLPPPRPPPAAPGRARAFDTADQRRARRRQRQPANLFDLRPGRAVKVGAAHRRCPAR